MHVPHLHHEGNPPMPMGTGDDTGHLSKGPQGGPAGQLYTPDGGKTWLEQPVAPSDTASRAAQIRALIGSLPPEEAAQFSAVAPAPVAPVYAGPPVPDDPAHQWFAQTAPAPVPTPAPAATDDPSKSTDPNVNENAPFSHWLHLADGTVRKSLGVVTHWHADDDPRTPGVPIVAAVANPAYQFGAGDMKARVRALLAELAGLTGIDLSNLANNL